MSETGIYRKVAVRMWGDARVRRLSPIPPSGQGLWVHLLTGEQTGPIPGVFKIGEAAFAEQLGWPLGLPDGKSDGKTYGFREAFREVMSEGLVVADWKARLVWVPKAIKWNPPASLNAVKSWATAWDLLPECDLKVDIYQSFKAFMEGMGDAFAHAFAHAMRDPGSRKQEAGSRIQQTGGRDQQQPEQRSLALTKSKPQNENQEPVSASPSPVGQIRGAWLKAYEAKYDRECISWGARESGQAKNLLKTWPLARVLELVPAFFAWPNAAIIRAGHPFGTGAQSFTMKIHELDADTHSAERRDDAAIVEAQMRESNDNAVSAWAGGGHGLPAFSK